jgi:hypothetical protein
MTAKSGLDAAGNQPRLKAGSIDLSKNLIRFDFVDITNLASPDTDSACAFWTPITSSSSSLLRATTKRAPAHRAHPRRTRRLMGEVARKSERPAVRIYGSVRAGPLYLGN